MPRAERVIYTDVLVIGSGLAGLMLALKLAECEDVSLVLASKGDLSDSNSSFAQGGLAAVTDANAFDSPAAHLADTLKSGAGLTDAAAAAGIIFDGDQLVAELRRLGVSFDKKGSTYELALEGGHSQPRVLHNKDATGRAITSVLTERIRQIASTRANVMILENACALELLAEGGICTGALLEANGPLEVRAPHTVLSTGGVGQIFQRTTNPPVATGDGIALAYRAGARLMDMEFMQFHPTALCKDGAPPFLISEAVRGAGGILTDHAGKRFAHRFHQDGELATRDIVARAIHTVMHEHGISSVYLDMRPIGKAQIAHEFPTIQSRCAQFGIDVLNEPIPVAPAAHYFMGGIAADVTGRTDINGLYAIGECASTGLHGANRLASNSLLEAGVMALRLAKHLLSPRQKNSGGNFGQVIILPEAGSDPVSKNANTPYVVPEDISRFRAQMYRYAGLVRSQTGLMMLQREPCVETVKALTPDMSRERNMYEVGMLIAQAALLRRESRGGHFRDDYPTLDNTQFGKRLWLSKTGSGWAIPQTDLTDPSAIHRQAARTA